MNVIKDNLIFIFNKEIINRPVREEERLTLYGTMEFKIEHLKIVLNRIQTFKLLFVFSISYNTRLFSD